MNNRSITASLAAAAAALLLPLSLHADTQVVNGIEWRYAVSNGKATLGGNNQYAISTTTSGAITIPPTLGGYPVTGIGARAFSNCRDITSISFPASLTSIGSYAFMSCSGLLSISIPSTISTIELGTFYGCSGLTSVTIPNSVKTIGSSAFVHCSGLKTVSIPNSVTEIKYMAFADCTKLTTITIPSSVRSIGQAAFSDCSNIESIVIPSSVTNMGYNVFSGCSSLMNLYLSSRLEGKLADIGVPQGCEVAFYSGETPSLSKVYKVSFDANLGSGSKVLWAFESDATVALPTNRFAKAGYHFTGWAQNASGPVSYIDGASASNLATPGTTTTLYAQWGANTYAVALDQQSGLGGTVSVTATYDSAMPSITVPTCTGYTFGGYFTAANGGGTQYYTATGTSARNWDKASTNTLYAKWTANTYTVTFDANGGEGGMSARLEYDTALTAPVATKTGHTFAGWLPEVTATVQAGDMTYTAQWTANNYVVTFNANGGTGGWTKSLAYKSALSAPTVKRTGYILAGWSPAVPKTVPLGGATYTAKWSPTTYKVAFNANGGKLPKGKKMAAQTMTYGKAAALRKNAFTRSGCVFLGWATKKGGAVAYKNGQSVKNLRTDGKAVTLYAVWVKKTYKVAFYANGGTGKMAVESFTYGKAKKLTANKFVAPKGKKFAGWATSKANAKAGKVKYKNGAAIKGLVVSGKTVKLYAVWKKK